jgi:hypothetical protein
MRRRSRAELETEIAESRERIALLEDTIARMLASPKYDPKGSARPAFVPQPPEPQPVILPPAYAPGAAMMTGTVTAMASPLQSFFAENQARYLSSAVTLGA